MNDPLTYLRQTAATLGDDVATLTERVLTYPGFTTCTGSIQNRHHYGEGGLLRHTAEVAQLCMLNHGEVVRDDWVQPGQLSKRALWLAAVTHDWAKVHDYSPHRKVVAAYGDTVAYGNTTWEKTPHHRLIHHVSRSAILWSQAVAETNLCRDIEEEVTHAILAHHGTHGSAMMPKTRVAWMLHLCDQISARMDDADRVDLRS